MLKPHGGVALLEKTERRTSDLVAKTDLVQNGRRLDPRGGNLDARVRQRGQHRLRRRHGPALPAGGPLVRRPRAGDHGQPPLRAAAPLVVDGRVFVQGENILMAYDAYNGVRLWQRPMLGAFRTNVSRDASNLAANRQALFVAIDEQCLRIDPATGRTLKTYALPPARRRQTGPLGLRSLHGQVGLRQPLGRRAGPHRAAVVCRHHQRLHLHDGRRDRRERMDLPG